MSLAAGNFDGLPVASGGGEMCLNIARAETRLRRDVRVLSERPDKRVTAERYRGGRPAFACGYGSAGHFPE